WRTAGDTAEPGLRFVSGRVTAVTQYQPGPGRGAPLGAWRSPRGARPGGMDVWLRVPTAVVASTSGPVLAAPSDLARRTGIYDRFSGSERFGGVRHDAAQVGCGLAGQADIGTGQLAFAGPPGELQVALEHLRHAVHAAVAEGAAARQHRQPGAGADAA